MYFKNLIFGRSHLTTRKKIPTYNFFYLFLNNYIYFLFLSTRKCFKCSFSKHFGRSAIFIWKCLLPASKDAMASSTCINFCHGLFFYNLFCFVNSKRQVHWYSTFQLYWYQQGKKFFNEMNIEISSALVSSDIHLYQ